MYLKVKRIREWHHTEAPFLLDVPLKKKKNNSNKLWCMITHVITPSKSQLMDVRRHEFFVIHRDSSRKQRMLGERVELSGCLDGSKVIGLQLCGSAAYPKGLSTREGPYVPLTTPAAVSVILHKRDTHTAFHLEAKALQEKVR